MRFLEIKRKSTTFFWHIAVNGNSVVTGSSTFDSAPTSSVFTFSTEREASAAAELAAGRKLDDGYSEPTVPEGHAAGVVRWNDGPVGPGWIRLWDHRDVHFEIGAVEGFQTLKIGTRVMVGELRPYSGTGADQTHAGKFEAGAVRPSPAARSRGTIRKTEADRVDADVRSQLVARVAAAEASAQATEGLCLGDLVFAWDKGIHRLIGLYQVAIQTQHDPQFDGWLAEYDPVFDSKFKRRRGPTRTCGRQFVRRLPLPLSVEIEALLR